MSAHRWQLLLVVLFSAGCEQQQSLPTNSPGAIDRAPAASEVFSVNAETFEYVRAAESQAELILVIELTTPAMLAPDIHRIPLRRNAKALFSGMEPYSSSWCACGGNGGYGGNVSARGGSSPQDPTYVSISVHWTRDGVHGERSGTIRVPWLGEMSQSLGPDSKARVYFVKSRS